MSQGRYVLTVVNWDCKRAQYKFKSRKQAYVFINALMFMNNEYKKCTLVDSKTGEVWLDIRWRGRDNYKRKTL